ncbi:outer membrane beta-barrel protein [Shewanella insulae]|uniref:outer membrane beta-barrel protein n=1 Tax=Shewanella insulae TaxID=2681496 RepID=UPI00247FE1AF|nr:outer membrane beta-barrel protein [Shewanella insulae]
MKPSLVSRNKINALFLGLTCLTAVSAQAAQGGARQQSPLTLSVSRIGVGEADVGDSGLALQRDTWLFGAKTSYALNRQWSLSASISYDRLEYDWSGRGASLLDGNLAPWSNVDRYGVGLGVSFRPNNRWLFMLAPKLQYAYGDAASSSNAQSYGVVASGMYRFNGGNMLGLGVAYLNDISEVRTLPYLAVNWQITDKLKLANPFSAGFSGPAGLELSYQWYESLDVGVGSSKRTQRFLVEDEDVTLEIDEWVGFVRAGWQATEPLKFDAYLGYFFSGEIELSSPKTQESLENQLALAFSAQYRF